MKVHKIDRNEYEYTDHVIFTLCGKEVNPGYHLYRDHWSSDINCKSCLKSK